MEQEKQIENISDLYQKLLEVEPKLVTNFVPEKQNAETQKDLFMSGAIRNPDHFYEKLESIDFEKDRSLINQLGLLILLNPELDKKQIEIYEEFVAGNIKRLRFMELAFLLKKSTNSEEKQSLAQEYMKLNIDLYGEPSEETYRSLLQEKLLAISGASYNESTDYIRKELFELVKFDPNSTKLPRFKPSNDTVEWLHDVAESLYGNLLRHVPKKDSYNAEDIKNIFKDIIESEFEESASDWIVDIEPAQTINVKTSEKRIVIPENRIVSKYDDLRGLVVHEIGVHAMRSIMGGDTNILPLQNGLSDYYDAEEGIAVVMEHALKGKYSESGIEGYITAGLAYCDGFDFRDTYEVKWRLSALHMAKKTGDVTEEMIQKAKNTAYSATMRSFRGTDSLPWFKDLAYYNGSADMWKYIEKIKEDDIEFSYILQGKVNPSSIKHRRLVYEAKTE